MVSHNWRGSVQLNIDINNTKYINGPDFYKKKKKTQTKFKNKCLDIH